MSIQEHLARTRFTTPDASALALANRRLELERVLAATSLPCLLLGGEVRADTAGAAREVKAAMALPNAMGLVIGRAVLYPGGGDVAAAVD